MIFNQYSDVTVILHQKNKIFAEHENKNEQNNL